VKVPFTWKVTGWFMVGWSPEFPIGEARPLHYFGEDLVAYRDESGELHVLEAHCKHLGAHIGDASDVPQGKLRDLIEKQFLSTVFDDLEIWRYQKYVEHPPLSKVDAKGYMALRKWATQFYEVPA
jgi:nitrite reductase/ring-hydroxylating ferredoxin subunit